MISCLNEGHLKVSKLLSVYLITIKRRNVSDTMALNDEQPVGIFVKELGRNVT